MPGKLTNLAAASASKRVVPGLRAIPVARLLLAAEIVLLAHDHVAHLDPAERRRIVQLVRKGHGRRRNLTESERDELAALVAKAEPRLFVGHAAQTLSPMPLPKWIVEGRARRH
ncbi:MAG: hypothetical protein JO240_09570 [Solirubrobacterales bacterium]|nr:hypothetical protein [Solirubrobacterales bacterium]